MSRLCYIFFENGFYIYYFLKRRPKRLKHAPIEKANYVGIC